MRSPDRVCTSVPIAPVYSTILAAQVFLPSVYKLCCQCRRGVDGAVALTLHL
jgi:hypothetical protein